MLNVTVAIQYPWESMYTYKRIKGGVEYYLSARLIVRGVE